MENPHSRKVRRNNIKRGGKGQGEEKEEEEEERAR
jgi:hypothetical protein